MKYFCGVLEFLCRHPIASVQRIIEGYRWHMLSKRCNLGLFPISFTQDWQTHWKQCASLLFFAGSAWFLVINPQAFLSCRCPTAAGVLWPLPPQGTAKQFYYRQGRPPGLQTLKGQKQFNFLHCCLGPDQAPLQTARPPAKHNNRHGRNKEYAARWEMLTHGGKWALSCFFCLPDSVKKKLHTFHVLFSLFKDQAGSLAYKAASMDVKWVILRGLNIFPCVELLWQAGV